MTEPPWSAEGRINSGLGIDEDKLVEFSKLVEVLLEDIVSDAIGVFIVSVAGSMVSGVVSICVGVVVDAAGILADASGVSIVESGIVGVVVIGVVVDGDVTTATPVVSSAGLAKSTNPPKKDDIKPKSPLSSSKSKPEGEVTEGVDITGTEVVVDDSAVPTVISAVVGVVVIGVVVDGDVPTVTPVVSSAGLAKSTNPPKKDDRKPKSPLSSSKSKPEGEFTEGAVITGEVVTDSGGVGVDVAMSVDVSVELLVVDSELFEDSSNKFDALKLPCMVVKEILSASMKSIPVISIE
tara:strand:- start:232 stop:1113 length:882 start_codon:yes stop_codon:yes gene_type:complete